MGVLSGGMWLTPRDQPYSPSLTVAVVTQHTHWLIIKKTISVSSDFSFSPPRYGFSSSAHNLQPSPFPPSVLLLPPSHHHQHLTSLCSAQHCKTMDNYFHTASSSVSFDSKMRHVKRKHPIPPPKICKCSSKQGLALRCSLGRFKPCKISRWWSR